MAAAYSNGCTRDDLHGIDSKEIKEEAEYYLFRNDYPPSCSLPMLIEGSFGLV